MAAPPPRRMPHALPRPPTPPCSFTGRRGGRARRASRHRVRPVAGVQVPAASGRLGRLHGLPSLRGRAADRPGRMQDAHHASVPRKPEGGAANVTPTSCRRRTSGGACSSWCVGIIIISQPCQTEPRCAAVVHDPGVSVHRSSRNSFVCWPAPRGGEWHDQGSLNYATVWRALFISYELNRGAECWQGRG